MKPAWLVMKPIGAVMLDFLNPNCVLEFRSIARFVN